MHQDRAHVEDLKEFCAKERERIYSRHQFGIGGREIVEEYTRLTDNVIQRIYHAATQEKILPESPHLAILALGGYGREELNPYSDIDIMLVYDAARVNVKQLQPFASELITILWDAGFEVGHSCRSIKELHPRNVRRYIFKNINAGRTLHRWGKVDISPVSRANIKAFF